MTQSEKKNEDVDGWRSTLAQVFAAASISWLCTGIGLIVAMPTIVIGALRGDDSPLGLSESQASWFGSLAFVIEPLGSLMAAFMQDILGRKTCLLFVNIPICVGWFIIYFSTSSVHLFFAISLMGFSMGFIEAPFLSYLGEISQPRIRGVLSSFGGVFYNSGLMLESFLGAVLPWRIMVLCSTLVPITGFIFMVLMPETPPWLVTKGRIEDAGKSYQWLRGWVSLEAVKKELEELVAYVKKTQKLKGGDTSEYAAISSNEEDSTDTPEPPKHKSLWQTMTEPEVLIALRIIFLYFIITSCASLTAMKPFFIEILTNLNSPVRPNVIVAVCGGLQMLGATSLGIGMKSLGKRGLTFVSLELSVFCCLGLSAYIYFEMDLPWVPVLLFCLSYFAGSFGIVHIPWILIIEMFPLRARGLAGGVTGAFGYILMFVVIKTYYALVSMVGVSGACLFYGMVGVVGFFYLYVDMVETEGFALEAIERKLTERRSTKSMTSTKTDPRIGYTGSHEKGDVQL